MRLARNILFLLALTLGAAARPALAAGPIVSGETLAGTLAGPTFLESWTFSGTAGDRVLLAAVTTSGSVNTNIVVKNPSGVTILSSSTDRGELALLATGTFTIDISDVGLNDAGTYNLCFVDLTSGPLTSAGDLDGDAIVSSDVKTGTMVAGDFDGFAFTGTIGDRILIDAVTTSGSLDTWIYLYPPGGGAPVVNSFGSDRSTFQLTSTGTHTIVIEDNGNSDAGGYSMSFLNVTAGPFTNGGDVDGGPILSNEIKTGQFNQGVDFDAYTFSGTAGQRIVLAGVANGGGGHDTQISVFPAGGGAAITSSTTDRFDVQLTTSGTYTLVIEDNANNNAGAYTISFVNLSAGPYTDGSDLDGGAITSSDVKTGTMSGAADFDAYTFSGTSGDRVLIDAVTTSGSLDTWIYLYPPGGGVPVVNSFGGDRANFQLTSTGTHTIVIEDNGSSDAGGYSMSFLNVTAGPFTNGGDTDGGAILSNEIKTGQFNQGVDFDAYTFSGTGGQRIVLAGVANGGGGHDTQISVFPAGGGAAIISSTTDRFDAQLTTTGTYTLVIEDNANNNAGAYTISFVNLSAGPYTDGSDLDGGAIVSSDAKTGTMSGIADFDAYTFSGTSGDRVLIDAVTTSGSLDTWIYLYPPGGGVPVVNSFGGDRANFQLTSTGTHTIVIEDNGNSDAGGYSMSFLNVTAGPFTNGGDTDGGAILSNEIKTGQFNQGVDFDAYTFSGTAAQRIVLAGVASGGGGHDTQISVFPAGGGAAIISSTTDRFDAQLTTSGTYTLVIEDNANNNAGAYTISFVNLSAGPYTDGSDLDGGAIVSSDAKTGTMSGIADFDAYTFSGTIGDRVLIDAVTTSGSLDTWIYLYPPGGGVPVVNSFGGDRANFQLTSTGTHTILIEDSGSSDAGSYSMSFLNVTAGPFTNGGDIDGGPILSNEIKTGQFNQGVDFDAYTFTGTAAQRIVLAGVANGGGGHDTQISVFPAGGGAAIISSTTDRFDAQLTTSGTYTLVIEDNANNNVGAYTISFVNLSAGPYTDGSDLDGGAIASSDAKTGTMSGVADFDAYTFSGTIGDRVLIDAVTTSGSLDTWIYLYPPGGGVPVVNSFGGDRANFQLTSTGTHTIVIEDNGNSDAGSYSMSFLNVTAGPFTNGGDIDGGPILSNEIKTGQFNQGVDFDGFTFEGSAGDRIVLAGLATGAGTHDTQISVFPAGGGPAINSSTTDRYNVQLTTSGVHTLVIEDNANNNAGAYTISFVNVSAGPLKDTNDANGGNIASNDIKSGTMSGIADFDAYQFVGSTGDRVLISAVTTSGSLDTWIYLYPPGGGVPVVNSFAADRVTFQLTSTGPHTIVIEDSGNDTAGAYNMSFLNVTAGPMSGGTAEVDGGPVTATTVAGSAFAAADLDGFTFFGTGGQTVNITAIVTVAPMDSRITLFPPAGGAQLVSTTNDNVVQLLSATGTYTIVIEDNLQDQTGVYNLTVTGVSFATDVPGGGVEPAEAFRTTLLPASPSPFLNSTRLDFRVAQEGPVQLRIYDVTGSLVRALVDETLRPGAHPAVWDGNDDRGSRVASGIYYVQLQTGGEVKRQKVVRIR